MAEETNLPRRIMVYLVKNGIVKDSTPANFTQSMVNYFLKPPFEDKNEVSVYLELQDNKLLLSDVRMTHHPPVKLRRPNCCPFNSIDEQDISGIPHEISQRGINVATAVILESSDDKVLLTRRASTLRLFPNVWVPPGGHIEENETLVEACMRELKEETGLSISLWQVVGGKVHVFALWESTYPPQLSQGYPKRHHIVVFFYVKLTPGLTSDLLMKQICLQQDEADACGWFNREEIKCIVDAEGDNKTLVNTQKIPNAFRALIINNKVQEEGTLPMAPLFNTSAETSDCERVIPGAKFALKEWLKRHRFTKK